MSWINSRDGGAERGRGFNVLCRRGRLTNPMNHCFFNVVMEFLDFTDDVL